MSRLKSVISVKCNICEKTFSTRDILKKHSIIVHKKELKKHIINIHEGNNRNVHEKQKNFKCELCAKYLASSENLKIHIKTIHESQSHKVLI